VTETCKAVCAAWQHVYVLATMYGGLEVESSKEAGQSQCLRCLFKRMYPSVSFFKHARALVHLCVEVCASLLATIPSWLKYSLCSVLPLSC
jgi:hypothetical protein